MLNYLIKVNCFDINDLYKYLNNLFKDFIKMFINPVEVEIKTSEYMDESSELKSINCYIKLASLIQHSDTQMK